MAYIERYYLDSLNEGIQFDQTGLPNSIDETVFRTDPSSGGGGGGVQNTSVGRGGSGGGTTSSNENTNVANADEYVIQIRASFPNKVSVGGTVYVNNIPLPNVTPNNYKVKLTTLFNQGPQTIEVKKGNYSTNEKYILSVVPAGDDGIDDITLLQDDATKAILGVNKLKLNIERYEDNVKKPFFVLGGTTITLPFTLTKGVVPVKPTNTNTVSINLIGPDSSVVITANNEDDFLDSGEETFTENTDTKYFIKSPNTTLYRISEVVVTDSDGNSETLTAGAAESISMELNITKDLTLTILSQRVVKKKILKPLIKLKSAPTKKYNINDKSDIPLIVEKNDDVVAISMVIGSEILEFDNLAPGRFVGIKIPHRLIESIGKYNIKLFPYSISELQNGKKNTNIGRGGSSRNNTIGRGGSNNSRTTTIGRSGSGAIVRERNITVNTRVETDTTLPPVPVPRPISNNSIGRSGS
jgi:hypothetical protein